MQIHESVNSSKNLAYNTCLVHGYNNNPQAAKQKVKIYIVGMLLLVLVLLSWKFRNDKEIHCPLGSNVAAEHNNTRNLES